MVSDNKRKVLDFFAEGRRYYKLMDFEQARVSFGKALELDPDDGPSKVYYARCKHYLDKPPPPDWNGIFVMKTE